MASDSINNMSGFTLIELIMAMVILSVLAIGSIQFISYSAQAYVQTTQRSHESASARVIHEKVSRYVRNALPNSVRVSSNGACVEFIPIRSASQYVQAPIVGSPNADTEIHIVPLDGLSNVTGYAAIYPLINQGLLYDNNRNPGRISQQVVSYVNDVNGASVYNLGGDFQFEEESPTGRLYFVGLPKSLCQQDTFLFLYENYGFVGDISNLMATLPSSVPNRTLIANQLVLGSVQFSLSSGELKRNNILSFSYQLQKSHSTEPLSVNDEVQVRNVP